MKRCRRLFAVLAVVSSSLHAGLVYGVILIDSKALRGAVPSVACGGSTVTGPATLADGSYRVRVPQQGRCHLTITATGLTASADVVSTADATPYNFEVVTNNGKYELRRK